MLLFVLSIAVALTVSFFCSLAEATLLSLTTTQIAEISGRRPRLGAIWQRLKANIERPITVILVFNTAAHTIGAFVAGSQFTSLYGERSIWLFSVLFTLAMLELTEILPKTIGVRFNRLLAGPLGAPLNTIVAVTTPLLRILYVVSMPFSKGKTPGQPPATIEEITALAGLARLSNEISAHQERIITGASKLSRMRVSQVMIPTEQVSLISTTQTVAEALISAHIDSHTRYPVCEAGDPDRIVGYLNFKELVYFMRTNPNDPSLRGIIRPVHFVSPSDSAASLMKVFVDQHIHLAVVRDAEGRTLGIVTLEDIIEELVGELEDEFDRLPKMCHPLSAGTVMAGGGIPVRVLAEQLGRPLPDPQITVSAWIAKRLGRVPRPGDVHREAGMEFLVRRVRRGKVFELSVAREREPEPEER